MKKIKSIIFVSTLFLGGLAFTACTSTDAESTEQVKNEVYHCPMDCEDGKTYDEAGICPVCEMDLVIYEGENEL